MDVVSALDLSYEKAEKLVAGLDVVQLDEPSPCAGWDVRATLEHLLGTVQMFTLVNQGHEGVTEEAVATGDDPAGAMSAVARENLASWRRPGAFDGDRTLPFGTFPAGVAALMNLEEVVVHCWDIAKATRQESAIAPEATAMVYEFCRSLPLDAFRAHGAFGPEVAVPEAAPPINRLVGLLGRQP
jgi:uncharacterized protein (TIGR03086 family)